MIEEHNKPTPVQEPTEEQKRNRAIYHFTITVVVDKLGEGHCLIHDPEMGFELDPKPSQIVQIPTPVVQSAVVQMFRLLEMTCQHLSREELIKAVCAMLDGWKDLDAMPKDQKPYSECCSHPLILCQDCLPKVVDHIVPAQEKPNAMPGDGGAPPEGGGSQPGD
jgi:hypothetical protein